MATDTDADAAFAAARARLDALEHDPRARAQLEALRGEPEAIALVREMSRSSVGCTNLARELENMDAVSLITGILARRRVDTSRQAQRDALAATVERRVGAVFAVPWWKK